MEEFKEIPPNIMAIIMSIVIAILRVIYDRDETSLFRLLLEALLCGALTWTAGSGIDAMGADQSWILFAGGIIGFLGKQSIERFAKNYLNHKSKGN